MSFLTEKCGYGLAKRAIGESIDWCIPQVPYLRKSRERRFVGTGENISWWETVKHFPILSARELYMNIIQSTALGTFTYWALGAATSGSPNITAVYLLLAGVTNKVIGGMVLDDVNDLEKVTMGLMDQNFKYLDHLVSGR